MKQLYENYSKEDLAVWSILFNRQADNLKNKACSDYLKAVNDMEEVLNAAKLPNFDEINNWFLDKTGWQIECVPGLIPVNQFFELLAEKKFPSSTWLRSMQKLDYLEEPDMFHDVFGHVPLLSNIEYSDFIHQFGKLGVSFISNEEKLLQLQRLYWFTIEFGLIKQQDEFKIYGAGILSSFGESISSLTSNEIDRDSFDLMTILGTEFCTSEMQTNYFFIDSLETLKNSINTLTKKWELNELEYSR